MGGDRVSKVGPEDSERLLRLVDDLPDATIAELTAEYTSRHGVELSTSAMHRALERAGVTRKKKASSRRSRTAPESPTSARRSASSRRS
jgi:transposase